MDGQLTIFDIDWSNSEYKQYIGKCEFCLWGEDDKTCPWSEYNEDRYAYRDCQSRNRWRPDPLKIPGLCMSCEYSNPFVFKLKDKYKGDRSKGIYDPEETPDIYCTKCGGPINRNQPYLEYYTHNFGIGRWDRQHELDTCECYKLKHIWKNVAKLNKGVISED